MSGPQGRHHCQALKADTTARPSRQTPLPGQHCQVPIPTTARYHTTMPGTHTHHAQVPHTQYQYPIPTMPRYHIPSTRYPTTTQYHTAATLTSTSRHDKTAVFQDTVLNRAGQNRTRVHFRASQTCLDRWDMTGQQSWPYSPRLSLMTGLTGLTGEVISNDWPHWPHRRGVKAVRAFRPDKTAASRPCQGLQARQGMAIQANKVKQCQNVSKQVKHGQNSGKQC